TCFKAFSTNLLANSLFVAMLIMASAKACEFFGSTKSASLPCLVKSLTPVTFVEIMGKPTAAASSKTLENPSLKVGNTKASDDSSKLQTSVLEHKTSTISEY